MNKKADIAMAILAIILIAVAVYWFYSYASRDCNANNNCSAVEYCGSDFRCHEYPPAEETIYRLSLTAPALILGISIIIAVILWKRLPKRQ